MVDGYNLTLKIERPVGDLLCMAVAACSPLKVFD
jgi:hypothetical protein